MRTLQSELSKKVIGKQITKVKGQGKSKPKPVKEKFSRREIEELMDKHRPTYHRVKGAFRSK